MGEQFKRNKKCKYKNKKYSFICPTCNNEFFSFNYVKNRKFCSGKCTRRIVPIKERIHRSKMAKEKHYGLWMKGKKHPPFSPETLKRMSDIQKKIGSRNPETEFKKGSLHINWKGGEKEAHKRRWQKVKGSPRLKIRQNFSSLISSRLKRRLLNKGGKSTFKFLPYTIEGLMQHIESQFRPGMYWGNYGFLGWHIDHIIPDCSFDYKSVDDEQFQRCWALDNLQPLWAYENIKKGGRFGDLLLRIKENGLGT